MPVKPLPSVETLTDRLQYDPATGTLRWRPRRPEHWPDQGILQAMQSAAAWNDRYAGKQYDGGYIDGARHKAHRIIWKMWYGSDPTGRVSHADGDRSNNRIGNLQVARSKPAVRRNNTSGVTGVSWSSKSQCWTAYITVDGNLVNLGNYLNFEIAVQARKNMEIIIEKAKR